MSQILLMLLEHPLTTGFLVLCGLGFIRMTYDFLLRLFGRKGFPNVLEGDKPSKPQKEEPPEQAQVPNPPPPDDIIEAEEEIPVDESYDME